jgi:sugar lactone lactonase YvrE
MAVVPCQDGGFVAASEDTVYTLDGDFRVVREVMKVKHPKPTDRFNDCRCAPDGAFFLGSMGTEGERGGGKLYRLGTDGTLSVVIDHVGISNGMAWSEDGKTFFYTDTIHGEIYAYDYNAEEATVSNRRVIFRDTDVNPDGFCADAEGNLWVALWGARKVICVDSKTGQVLGEVFADAPHTSAAVFGGKELNTLYITSSRQGLTEEDIASSPLSGALFEAKVDVRGALMNRGGFSTR